MQMLKRQPKNVIDHHIWMPPPVAPPRAERATVATSAHPVINDLSSALTTSPREYSWTIVVAW